MKKLQVAATISAFGYLGLISAQAAWTENFDSYLVGNVSGNGPWVDWGGTLTPDVTTTQANSGPNSLGLSANPAGTGTGNTAAYGSDVYATTVDPSGVLTSGQWSLTYQLYLESAFTGIAEMYVSQVAMDGTGASFADGLWLRATDAGTFDLANTTATANPTLVYDTWTEVELLIDLDNDTATGSYNGSVFYTGVWDIATTGTPGLGGINFWVNGVQGSDGTYFVDDFSLQQIPEPSVMGVLAFGALLTLRSRRRHATSA